MRRIGPLVAIMWVLAAASARAGPSPCWYEHGAVVAAAAFGDIAGDFIVDFSAPESLLHATVAQAHGLTGDSATADLALAGAHARRVNFRITDLDARGRGFPTNIVGVIGADATRRFVIDLTLSPCRIEARKRTASHADRAPIRLRLVWRGGAPMVAAAVSDGVRSAKGLFAVDTGSQGVRLAAATLSRPAKDGDATSRTDPPARLRALSIGGQLIEEAPAGLIDAAAPGSGGAIGNAVWVRFGRMRLDARAGRLELWP